MVNLNHLYKTFNDNEEIVIDMVKTIIIEIPKSIHQAEEALKKEDWDGYYINMHKLKPTLKYIGLKELAETVDTLEKCARDRNSLSEIFQKSPGIMLEIKKAMTELQEFVDSK